MAMTKNEKYIVEQYVRYFGKVPTDAQIADYADLGKPKLILAQIRGEADDAKAGMSSEEFVNSIFQNLFGRDASTKELNKYSKMVDNGKDLPINAIVKNAKPSDKKVYQTKKAVAELVATEGSTTNYDLDKITKDTYADIYNPKTKKLLVDTVAELDAEVEAMPDNVTGQTFTLTAGTDTLTGTEKGDVFNAYEHLNLDGSFNPTLTGIDSLDGGAGKDVLNVKTDAAIAAVTTASISNIETINLESASTVTFDTTTFTGVETLNATKGTAATLTAGDTTDVNVSGITGTIVVKGGNDVVVNDAKAGAAITVSNGATGNATGAITVTDTDNSGANNIIINGGTDVNVTTTATASSGTLAIGAADSASEDVVVVSNLNTDGTAAATGGAIAVTGGKTVNVTVNGTVVSKDDAGNVALKNSAVTVTADNTTTDVTVKQTTSVTDYRVAEVAEVKATQTITFKDLAATKNVVINGLTFTASKNLTAAEVAAAFANLTSSDTQSATGITDNGVFTNTFNTVPGWTSAAANGATVTFTAPAFNSGALVTSTTGTALTVGSIVAGTATVTAIDSDDTAAYGAVVINDNATASITTVTVDGYASADLGKTGTDLNALTTLSLANSAGNADVATSATTLALTLNNVNNAVDISTASAGVATLNVTTTGEDSAFALTAAHVKDLNVSGTADLDLTGSTLTALENVVVSGTAGLDLGAVVASKSINTTATTGDVTASINGTAATYTGGAGVDTVTLVTGTALTKAIDLGAGDDTLIFNAVVASTTATLAGGAGTDTISMTVANAAALDGSETFKNSISGFERLTLNNAFGGTDAIAGGASETETINLANLGFASYVTTTGTSNGGDDVQDTLILDKLAANATVVLTANGLITAQLADVTGTADVINVEISDNAGNVGTFKAAGVETIKVTTTNTFVDNTGALDVEGVAIGDGLDDTTSSSTLALDTAAAKTISVTGAGDLTLTTTSTVLTTIDASTMTGSLTYNAVVNGVTVNAGSGADILTVTADSLKINAGAGDDSITIVGGADLAVIDGGAGADTFNFTGVSTNKSNYAVIKGVNSGDVLKVTGATSFSATEITLAQGATETTQAYLDQAMTTLSAGQIGWFQLNGNTYVTADLGGDSANSFTDGTDFVVMINGLVDLGTGASYNATSNTLEIA